MPTTTIGDRHRPLRDKVIDELRRRIIDGVYSPGDRLTEDRLADAFGVSRNPVREAIRVLEAEGFLVGQPRRGAVVAQISVQDVHDLFDIRLALEVLAARLVAERAGDVAGAALDEILTAAKAAAAAQQLDQLADLNTRFHAEICAYSGNALLRAMMETLHTRLQWVYRQSAKVRAPHSWAEHEALVAAIRASDPEAAGAAARIHVLNARRTALTLTR
ncbi:MAG TPA: GntR family transcriptional regulator [Micromonosporaceae bacterium]|nr:GntR family transcriptional regulator [Micromonosporaceae bacterium]